jgi:hypothetical protein
MEESLVKECKIMINEGADTEDLQAMFEYHKEQLENVDWPYVLQKVYIHACLKKKAILAQWLQEQFQYIDPINQIAYRQTFAYGKHLLQK